MNSFIESLDSSVFGAPCLACIEIIPHEAGGTLVRMTIPT